MVKEGLWRRKKRWFLPRKWDFRGPGMVGRLIEEAMLFFLAA
jgi:hypothetical protein